MSTAPPSPGRIKSGPSRSIERDPLSEEQRERVACAWEAKRILGEDGDSDDVIKLGDWLFDRHVTRDVRVLPSESLIEQVVRRTAQITAGHWAGWDAATYSPAAAAADLDDTAGSTKTDV